MIPVASARPHVFVVAHADGSVAPLARMGRGACRPLEDLFDFEMSPSLHASVNSALALPPSNSDSGCTPWGRRTPSLFASTGLHVA